MPNFIANKIKPINLPLCKNGVKFINIAKGRKIDLVLAEVEDEQFFITIKPKQNSFIVKGEKLTRPSKVGLLQKSLEVFRDEFCEDITESAFKYNKNSLIKNSEIIKSDKDAIEIINSGKFTKICIEIGFGSGRHLLYRAKEGKDVLFIGIEIYKPAIEQVAKIALKEKLSNIYLVDYDARIFLSLIESNFIDKIYLHFPVPWDDAPHRRVISKDFLDDVQRVLKKDGIFELRSDSREYVDFSMIKFLDMDKVEISVLKNHNLAISSKYEDRWKKQQKDIYDVFVKNCVESLNLASIYELKFTKLNPKNIFANFKNETYKFDDFFVHFEEIYEFGESEILIKLSFGGFNTPENGFIKISKDKTEYFINSPLKTEKNYKAHKKIEELLFKWSK